MKYLKIRNNGVLDMRLIALMGGTTKANDAFKIGQYGTGLKYYIAFCLRNNIHFRIFCGNQEVFITTEEEIITGETFDIIYINGERTSITTNMGLDWKAWMVIREIWCNALDEGEAYREETDLVMGHDGYTTFYTQISSEIAEVVKAWDRYFIHTKTPLFSTKEIAVYPGGDKLRIYKNGVLVYEDIEEKKSVFDYDLRDAYINELREFRGSVGDAVIKCLYTLNEEAARFFLEHITEKHKEADIDLNWWGAFNDAWKTALHGVKLIHKKAIENMRARGIDVDEERYMVVPKNVFDVLTKQFEGISAVMTKKQTGEFYPQYSKETELMVNKAMAILETCNIDLDKDVIFAYGYFADQNVLARIDIENKTIYVSVVLASGSLFNVVAMIIEEFAHYYTGHGDCSRAFQQYFIDAYTKILLLHNQIEL